MQRLVVVLLAVASLAACQPPRPDASRPSAVPNLAERFVAAYNQHDTKAMLALVHPELKYMFISGDQVHTETHNKDALAAFLGPYFANNPGARSAIVSTAQQGPFIQQVEQAWWIDQQGQPKSQCSQSIYQIKQQLIVHVWYFDAFPCP